MRGAHGGLKHYLLCLLNFCNSALELAQRQCQSCALRASWTLVPPGDGPSKTQGHRTPVEPPTIARELNAGRRRSTVTSKTDHLGYVGERGLCRCFLVINILLMAGWIQPRTTWVVPGPEG